MSEDYYNTTSHSCFGQLCYIVIGIMLFCLSFPILFRNESKQYSLSPSLEKAKNQLVEVQCDHVNHGLEGKPIYMTGDAKTEETLKDDYFPVTVTGFKLRRNVEMYQWVEEEHTETKRRFGGSEDTVTTYTYKKQWFNHPVDSNKFHESSDHENPAWDLKSGVVSAKTGTFGLLKLSESIIDKISWYEPFKIEYPSASTTSSENETVNIPEGYIYYSNGFYKGNPEKMTVGDIRVSFEYIPSSVTISLISGLYGNSFTPYKVDGAQIEYVEKGIVSPDAMFKSLNNNDNMLTCWVIRLAGFIMMFIGLRMILHPLVSLSDEETIEDSAVEFLVTAFLLFLAFALTLLTIGVAHICYNPIIGFGLLIAGIVSLILSFSVKMVTAWLKKKKPKQNPSTIKKTQHSRQTNN